MNDTMVSPEAEQAVEQRLNGASDVVLQRLAETFGARASASAAYGIPVERGAVTVIPVAKVRWVFGGGGGTGQALDRAGGGGSGGGGGTIVSPVGYLTIRDDAVEFHEIKETIPTWMVPPALLVASLIASAAITVVIALRTVGSIFRR